MAEALLVFWYLMIPSVMTALLARSIGARLAIGWPAPFLASVAGLAASFRWDLSTKATLIVTFGAGLVLAGGVRWVSATRWWTFPMVGVGVGVGEIKNLHGKESRAAPAGTVKNRPARERAIHGSDAGEWGRSATRWS